MLEKNLKHDKFEGQFTLFFGISSRIARVETGMYTPTTSVQYNGYMTTMC